MELKSISCAFEDLDLLMLKDAVKSKYKGSVPRCYLHSYGCQQNVSDGEKLKGMIVKSGFSLTDDESSADLIVINTCAVRENAHERVFGRLGELGHLKKNNSELIICVCGCMVQQEHIAEKIKKTYPFVSLAFGTFAYSDFYRMLREVIMSGKRVFNIEEKKSEIIENIPAERSSSVRAYVSVMYGCNNFCTYCIVPYVRGRERSRPIDSVVDEVKGLVNDGYKEITLLGQNVNSYAYGFPKLLKRLNDIEGDFWIRFMSSHPKDATKELIDTMLDCDKICSHLHLPVQSGNDEILNKMNRRYSVEKYLEIVRYARSRCKDFSFSTDIIVGFPGESYEQFCDTKKLLEKVKYDNVYSFVYSKREGTKAAELEDNISVKQKGLWLRELLLMQREITEKWLSRFVGKTLRVLAEDNGKKEGTLSGHSYENIIVEFVGEKKLIGSFVNIKITKALNWALIGEIV